MTSDERLATLDSHTYPCGPVTPDAGSEHLDAFLAHATDASIVGLGEATHGTRELFEMKHRLLGALVTEGGFRTLAVETDFANTLALDRFVQHGTGTAAEALDELLLWVWKTEEISAVLEWLRRFNEGRPTEDRVRVHGVSLSGPDRPARALRSSLDAIEAIATPADESLDTIADEEIPDDETARESFFERGADVANTVRDHLDEHRGEYIAASSDPQFRIVRHLCRHLEQACAWNRRRLSTPGRFDPDAFEQRDRYMAENVGWCVDTDPGDGVVVWAHNSHVQRGSFDMDYDWADGVTMGEFLDRDHEATYRPYATTLPRGKFRAVVDDDRTDGPQIVTVEEPGSEAIATAFTHSERKAHSPKTARFLDIEAASEESVLENWFEQTRHVLGAPALVDPEPNRGALSIETTIPDSFDGIIHTPRSTPSRPLKRDR